MTKIPQFGKDHEHETNPPKKDMQDEVDLNLDARGDLVNSTDATVSGGRAAFQLVIKTMTKTFKMNTNQAQSLIVEN
jgi:hypothetical protein